jgi:hypothetical protein
MQRHPDLEYPDAEYDYFVCAKEFGWTIKETDEQPANTTSWLIAMVQAFYEVQNEQSS